MSLSSKTDLEFHTCMCLDKVEESRQFVKIVSRVQIAKSKQEGKMESLQELVTAGCDH